jgi:hypothetical protein
MPEVFIYVQQEVLVMAHTPPYLAKRKSRARQWSMTIQARDDKYLCMPLMARPTCLRWPLPLWLGFLQLHDWQLPHS